MSAAGEKLGAITPEMNRRNGLIFIWTQLLIYFSAPVLYVGVVQAAFCDKLGASATVANLPSSTYLLGAVFPVICAWLFPARLEQAVAKWAFAIVAASMLLVCVAVFFPAPNWLRIAVVIGQGLIMGIINSITNVYTFKCLARGTTESGRARALKFAFGFGPVAAVLGSLSAQLLLSGKIPAIPYPYNFGILYVVALPCMAACAVISGRYRIVDVPDEPMTRFWTYLWQSVKAYVLDPRLIVVWIAFLLWYCTLGAMTNLSLYTREAVGRAPLELAGLIMALRFGFKAVAGFALGAVAQRWGARIAMMVTVIFVGSAMVWPFFTTGYGYLLAFGLMGAGELGGVYFVNYVIAISPAAHTTRNIALLSLVSPAASFVPALHGGLTDHFGFSASFTFGATTAALAFGLLLLFLGRSIVRGTS
ncbi:MAG: transporter [Verrucomicrobia bacterium]|nr:transporter [Verrucomicrobiota bacterium]